MGRIREYAEMSGDPFSFRRPKWARKLTIKKVARAAAPFARFIPGIGSAMEVARGYGFAAGDPKRKSAGAGPKKKAQVKAVHRAQKSGGHVIKGPQKRRPSHNMKKIGGALGQILVDNAGNIASAAGSAYDQYHGGHTEFFPKGTAQMPGGMPTLPGMPGAHRGFGGHRRSMNMSNVKALKRGIRRVEGFQKLAKSVFKAFPAMKHGAGLAPAARAHGGHKAGCRCVACKHR